MFPSIYYPILYFFFFFFNDTATTEIYTLSLHDALPICVPAVHQRHVHRRPEPRPHRSEEHTSELQSRENLVCRLLLETKKNKQISHMIDSHETQIYAIKSLDRT